LSARAFNSPDGWFRLEAPRGNWQWFEMRAFDGDADPRWPDGAHQTVAWFVRSSGQLDHFVVMESYDPSAKLLDEDYRKELERGTMRSATPNETISDFRSEWIGVPTEKSIRYSYKVVKSTGGTKETVYRFAHVTGWEHKVILQTSSATRDEPREFTR